MRPVITPHVDTMAVNLLERANRMLYAAQTLRASVQTTRTFKGRRVAGPQTAEVWASKPGALRINLAAPLLNKLDSTKKDSGAADIFSMPGVVHQQGGVLIAGEAADALFASMRSGSKGREIRIYTPERSLVYISGKDTARARDSRELARDAAEYGLQAFFGFNTGQVGVWTSDRAHELLLRSVAYKGKESWNGKSYDVVEWIYENAFLPPSDTVVYTTRFFIGGDSLMYRSVTESSTGYQIDRIFDLKPGAAVSQTAFSLPKQSIMIIPQNKTADKSLVGKSFVALSPGATLLDVGPFTLDKILAGRKAVLLWLWSTGCSSCVEEFPIAEKWLRDLGPRGLGAVAIDYAGDMDKSLSGVTRSFNRATMPIAFGADSWTKFMIDNNASFVLLDGTGNVVYQGGFDKQAILAAIKKLL